MKNKLSLTGMIITMLVFGNLLFGQENLSGPVLLDEAQKLGRLPKDFPFERMRRVPKGCPKEAKPYVVIRNSTTGVVKDQNMTNFFGTFTREFQTQFPPRGYGEKSPNRWFGDSFPIGSCKICAANLTAKIENEGASNDSLLVYYSDTTLKMINGGQNTSGNRHLYLFTQSNPLFSSLWLPNEQSKTLSLDLNINGDISQTSSTNDGISKINNYIFTTTSVPALEVFVQDDTRVNSMELLIWR